MSKMHCTCVSFRGETLVWKNWYFFLYFSDIGQKVFDFMSIFFGQISKNCILRVYWNNVEKKIPEKYPKIFKNLFTHPTKKLQLFVQFLFQWGGQKCTLRVHMNSSTKNIFKNWFTFSNFSDSDWKKFRSPGKLFWAGLTNLLFTSP